MLCSLFAKSVFCLKALAESISEFEPSSESEDDGHLDDVDHCHGDCDDHTEGDGCHGEILEHQDDSISDNQSISSIARLVVILCVLLSRRNVIILINLYIWYKMIFCMHCLSCRNNLSVAFLAKYMHSVKECRCDNNYTLSIQYLTGTWQCTIL